MSETTTQVSEIKARIEASDPVECVYCEEWVERKPNSSMVRHFGEMGAWQELQSCRDHEMCLGCGLSP